jgi:hypothetical protein
MEEKMIHLLLSQFDKIDLPIVFAPLKNGG